MARFIRTRDGRIFDLQDTKVSSVEYIHTEEQLKEYGLEEPSYSIYYFSEDEGQHLEHDGKGGHSMDCIDQSEILMEGDKLEEVCDKLVSFDNFGRVIDVYGIINLPYTRLVVKSTNFVGYVMAAICTDKGIMYVAKMNNQGEWESICL